MLPERLKTLRSEAKLTQKEIANKLNISQKGYSYWERGEREPNNDSLQKLANIFNVSTDYLLGKTDQVKKSTFDEDLEKSLESFHAFSGKTMSENDREAIKQWLIDNFKDKY
ncbi:transcriptional regulator [Lactococcus piscium]|uniref:Transcriptional regulator n=1 Tax=Pseudolactococcus piscium TaxID=1364 RepID=A0A2A5RW94_9LACT|nr:helix-turn-helix transcriptional regulator [Lactococcus piscium]PCS05509.1 transcriptional regulator [Lactococcus piscium]